MWRGRIKIIADHGKGWGGRGYGELERGNEGGEGKKERGREKEVGKR